jgi:23S rRNA (adenine2503-C2)-methyltransferase
MKTSAYSLRSLEWLNLCQKYDLKLKAMEYLRDGLYKNRSLWNRHLSPQLLELFTTEFEISLPHINLIQESQDGTIKFLVGFNDGTEVETVLIPFHKRYSICLSTQVGCAMNCSFCFTGTQGLKRNLEAGEIVGQYLLACNYLKEKNLSPLKPSIVFMGQGEPLHNAEAVKQAIEVLTDKSLVDVGHRQLTLSTVGYLPKLADLKNFPRINIALSLHSPFEDQRRELIPLNERYPLKEILPVLDELPLLPRQFITYEYLLVKDFNMSDRHAEELERLLGRRKALLNLIPFNPFPNSRWQRPTTSEIEAFKQKLVQKKLRVMVRTTKGDDILAACGQLKVEKLARNYDQTR